MSARRVVLVRHAHAAPLDAAGPAAGDAQRPLTGRGRAEAGAAASWLHARGAGAVDLALVSPAARAVQTWELLAGGATPVRAGTVRAEDRLYETSAHGLVALLAELPEEAGSVLVVGHEPVLSQAAHALAGPAPVTGSPPAALAALRAGITPATAVVLEADVGAWGDLAAGTCRLVDVGPR